MRRHSFRNYWLAGLLVLSGLFFPLQAQAISLDFSPVSQTVNVSDPVLVDIVVSGLEVGLLNQAVTAFNLTVSYDALVLTATSLTFGTALDAGILGSFQFPQTFSPGQVSTIAELSLENDGSLQATQGDSVTLGTLSFQAFAPGTSPLTFSFAELVGINSANLDFSQGTGGVTARQSTQNPIPEPSTMLLMATGAIGLLAWRRWKK